MDEETRGEEVPTGTDTPVEDEGDPAWLEECEFCGETFDSENELRAHKESEHEAVKDDEHVGGEE